MLLNNEIAVLQKELDGLELKYTKTKDRINEEEHSTSSKMQLLAKIMLSIDNIYDIAQNSSVKIRVDKKTSEEEMFNKVKSGKENRKDNKKDKDYEYNVEEYIEKLNVIHASNEAYKRIIDMCNKEKKKGH